MNITMIAAISTDGYIAGNGGDVSWNSVEDAAFLHTVVQEHKALIMGSKTFMKHRRPTLSGDDKTRIVLTKNPESYAAYIKEATFVSASVQTILKELLHDNCPTALILGGSSIYTETIRYRLADTLYITIEPVVLSSGTALYNGTFTGAFEGYTLVDEHNLNIAGTRLLTFKKS